MQSATQLFIFEKYLHVNIGLFVNASPDRLNVSKIVSEPFQYAPDAKIY